MKTRAEHRAFNFPFLYDGETQEATSKYGPVATPHVFVFDQARTLRYQGRIDSSPREVYAKVADTRLALDAVLSGGKVPVEKTPTVGCSIKSLEKTASTSSEQDQIKKEPVTLTTVDAACLEALGQERRQRQDAPDQLLGDMVRAVHGGVPRSAGDLADVQVSVRSSWSPSPSTFPTRRPACASPSRRNTPPRRTCYSGRPIPTS